MQNLKEKQISFTSGVYDNGLATLKEFLGNYSYSKVCFISCGKNYLLYKAFVASLKVESVHVLSDDKATNNNFLEVQNVCLHCDLLVCLDYQSVNYCKKLNDKLKINCFYFFSCPPPINVFLPYYYEFDGKSYIKVQSSEIKHYIINYKSAKEINREELVPCLCSIISVYCGFLDIYINSYLFGFKLVDDASSQFEKCTQNLSVLLSQVRFMPDNFVDKLYALSLDFVDLVTENNLTSSNSVCFAHIYSYLTGRKDKFYDLCMFSSQIFVHLFSDFFAKYKQFNNIDISIAKKQKIYKKYLQADYFVNDKELEHEQMVYLIERSSEKLKNKCSYFCTLVDRFVDKVLDLYADCGYSLYKNIDKNKTLLAIYFVPDFNRETTLLNVICDYGILDNIVQV